MTKRDGDFFVGWAQTPKADRRFLLGAAIGLLGISAGAAAMLAQSHEAVGTGVWDQGDVRAWPGYLIGAPYPMLRTSAIDGTMRTVLLATSGKTGVHRRILGFEDGPVIVQGSLIQRGQHAMLAAIDGADWIRSDMSGQNAGVQFSDWREMDLGEALLVGEILDAKCWFGAMRPGSGKVHKACATLCIRGGLPPAFCAGGAVCGEASAAPLLLQADGSAHGAGLLPFVADPVRAIGRIVRIGDVEQFRVDLANIQRL